MEPNGVPTTFCHHSRSSSSSDRFLNIFSSSPSSTTADSAGDDDELNEDEILWTGDFTEPNHRSTATSTISTTNEHRSSSSSSSSFPLNSGILAALPDFNNHSVIHRKPSISSTSSKLIPSSIPRPPPQDRDYSLKTQSMPCRKFQQSAPMNVPALSMAMVKRRNNKFIEVDDEKGDDDEMLPPHEIVARGSGMSPKATFSVLEGVGRTLKGRDLRQVRNAVWRKTGFLDS